MTWLTILHTIPKENYVALLDYCKRAAEQDKTFKFTVKADTIIIESPSRDIGFKRGALFNYHFQCYYEVVKK